MSFRTFFHSYSGALIFNICCASLEVGMFVWSIATHDDPSASVACCLAMVGSVVNAALMIITLIKKRYGLVLAYALGLSLCITPLVLFIRLAFLLG
ncbi:hypothetical protein [Hymenobacter sp. HSC-4F20]|uniref:hypothetical protein n=1 Tax=Hymenobacter sp. HSC-4F20 TaxID=2864135 RepID=UPI001C72CD22|nr:hypothetical protein [Hymenobacter sp. HSC-4F20]